MVHYFDRTGDTHTDDAEEDLKFPLWTATLQHAITFAQRDSSVQPSRIGVLGVSLGAFMALAVAAVDHRVRAIAVISGGFFDALRGRVTHLPPTLVQHDGSDDVVSVALAREADDVLQQLHMRHALVVYPGQGHHFDADAAPLVECRAIHFLATELSREHRGLRAIREAPLAGDACESSRVSQMILETSGQPER